MTTNFSTRDFSPQNQTIALDSKKDGCNFDNNSWTHSRQCNFKNSSDGTFLEKCDRWVYDTSMFHSTIVSDVSIENLANYDEEQKFKFYLTYLTD
jgi:hypothetical protein